MKNSSSKSGPGAIELVEEAVHLLRRAPAGVFAFYAIGTLPFVLAFLYFWAEMSRGAYASEYASTDALGLALVFLWMKCWQAVFVSGLREQITGNPSTPWRAKRVGRLALTQSALQAIGLFILPISAFVVVPFGWTYAFFQNVTVVADGTLTLSESSKLAAAQSSLHPERSYLALVILSAFSFFVWVNIAIFLAALPELLKMLLGIDNAYTREGYHSILNTTYLACTIAITYLCVDPLAKAIYTLRCFYGQSLHSGEDLRAGLARVRSTAVVALFMFFCLTKAIAVGPSQQPISSTQLNQAIEQVQKESQYTWRMPRQTLETADDSHSNWIVRMLRSGAEAVVKGLKWVGHTMWDGMKWVWRQIEKLMPKPSAPETSNSPGFGWAPFLQAAMLILIVAIASFLAVIIVRNIRRRPRQPMIMAEPVQARPDLNDENVSAAQNSEEGWMAMGRELIAQGNLRLGLRAFYLAGLAHLATREFILIAMSKSNREYELELRRRARAGNETLGAFSANVAIFDRVWYGAYAVTSETLQQFEVNLQQIRAC